MNKPLEYYEHEYKVRQRLSVFEKHYYYLDYNLKINLFVAVVVGEEEQQQRHVAVEEHLQTKL